MRRAWVYGAMVLVSLSLAMGAGGFTSETSERSVEIWVVNDENAYLGIETLDTEAAVGQQMSVLRLTDNFGQDVDLDGVTLTNPPNPVSLLTSGPSQLDPHQDVTVKCTDEADDEDVQFEIDASGDGVSVHKTKTLSLTCVLPPIQVTDVRFNGCGNAVIGAHQGHFPLDVTLFGYRNGTGVTERSVTVEGPNDRTSGVSGQLIGLHIPSADLFVTNPNYDFDGKTCRNSGGKKTGEPGDPREELSS